MTEEQKIITVNGKEINVLDYLTTLKSKGKKTYSTTVQVAEYYQLGALISSLINVCRVALENNQFDVNNDDISRVLELTENLIPYKEIELLDKLSS